MGININKVEVPCGSMSDECVGNGKALARPCAKDVDVFTCAT